MIGPKEFKEIVSTAQELGALSASAVWALFCIVLVGFLVWRERNSKRTSDAWTLTRAKDVEADLLNAQALQKLADAVSEIKLLLLTDRISKGNNHV